MSRAELLRSLAACLEAPGPGLAPVAAALGLPRPPTSAEHTDTFLFQLHPFASVHLGPEGQLGGVARDRVAGFFRALDVAPPPEPDHLGVLLGAYAELLELDDGAGDGRARLARTVLLHEHLWSWLPTFLARVRELAPDPYVAWAELLERVLRDELAVVGPPATLPAHLREAPPLPDPRDGDAAAFLAGLLAPVRSGMVVTRADLAAIARRLGIGLRIGERAYMLRAMLGQDHAGVLHALAAEAAHQADAWSSTDPIGEFWRARSAACAHLLTGLAAADDGVPAAG